MRTRTFTCPSGVELHLTELGFGGAPLGNLYEPVPEDVAQATLGAAWNGGMRVYDTSPYYGLGLSEERFGRMLADKPRAAYALSTKFGRVLDDCPPDEAMPDHFFDTPSRRYRYDYSYDGVMRSHADSLRRLGAERIDIFLCHDVDVLARMSRQAMEDALAAFRNGGFRACAELRERGAIRAIGAGLNEWNVAEAMVRDFDLDLVLLAGRYTLLEQEALTSFLPLCEERGVGIILGGPYNSGVLATGARAGATYDYSPAPQATLDRVAAIERVCAAHNVPLAAAALRFPLAHPSVVTVVPGGRTPAEVAQNIALFDVTIPGALWADLKSERLIRPDAPAPG